jgi:hypothetical protein
LLQGFSHQPVQGFLDAGDFLLGLRLTCLQQRGRASVGIERHTNAPQSLRLTQSAPAGGQLQLALLLRLFGRRGGLGLMVRTAEPMDMTTSPTTRMAGIQIFKAILTGRITLLPTSGCSAQ